MERVITIFVIIPAYESDEKLINILQEIKLKTDYAIVVVDDGSSIDKSTIFQKAEEYGKVLRHLSNLGKGRAIKTALSYIQDNITVDTGIAVMDSDGQHKVEDMIKVSKGLENNKDNLVIGSRRFPGNIPARSKFGNTLTKHVFRLATGVKVNDTQTGLRAFSSKQIPFLMKIPGDRYEYEMNMLLESAKSNITITEIPIETVYLDKNNSSHFRVIKDSVRIYKDIIKFSCASFASFLVDFLIYSIMIWLTKDLVAGTSLFISNITARVISASFNFYINKRYVFDNKDHLLKAAVKYFLLALFILAVNTGLLTILNAYVLKSKLISKIIIEFTLFIFSWSVQRFYIFRRRAERE